LSDSDNDMGEGTGLGAVYRKVNNVSQIQMEIFMNL
jgi:hypothetical protein